MLTLYQVEWCPYCHRVRQKMTELELTYTCVNVPAVRDRRDKVREVSGQQGVPVLVDGDQVLHGSATIIEHLVASYPPPDDVEQHSLQQKYIHTLECSIDPDDACLALTPVLAEHRIQLAGQTNIGDYVLMHAYVPAASRRMIAIDPTLPSALTFSIGVFPTDRGSMVSLVSPTVSSWLLGAPDMLRTNWRMHERTKRAVESLAAGAFSRCELPTKSRIAQTGEAAGQI